MVNFDAYLLSEYSPLAKVNNTLTLQKFELVKSPKDFE